MNDNDITSNKEIGTTSQLMKLQLKQLQTNVNIKRKRHILIFLIMTRSQEIKYILKNIINIIF